ncbi:recombinase RecT [Natroniella acetigena]|uniref:recombinase RecT n=1 Tax=Natroniella acetigena TaxID=52004 RepID=UPI00200B9A1D|nr:recombinase RecT [Natroniella acetigena]MCK8826380.1 recombinase RecT [Natroniella acetigena]
MSKNQLAKVNQLKKVLEQDSVQEQFQNALDENAGAFTASIIDLYNNDNYLQKCDPKNVVMEALKAATLKLPINKQMGFAYIVPYKNKPEFQIGYKGYIQLAMRTGQYKHLNAGEVYEGMSIEEDFLTGSIEITGEKTGDIVGYFAYMELLNGFSKTVYMTKEEVQAHGKEYSKSYSYSSSAWQTNFDQMAKKTVMRRLLSKYGIMSVEMVSAFSQESSFNDEAEVQEEIDNEANSEVIDIDTGEQVEEDEEQDPAQKDAPKEPAF